MNKKVMITALLLCVGLSSQLHVAYASEDGRDVIVSYSPSEENLARFQLQVNIVGNGSVFDGSQELTNNNSIYSLKVDEEKTFRINPMKGYHLTSIMHDGKDITNLLKADGTITVKGMKYNTVLTFTYEKDATKPIEPKPENPDKPEKPNEDKPTTGPKTGDTTNSNLLMSSVLLSGAGIFFILWKKRREEEEELEEE